MPPGGQCWGCPKKSLSLQPSQDNKPRRGLWEMPQGDKSAPRLPNSVRRPAGTESTSSDPSASPHCTIAARGLCSALSTRLGLGVLRKCLWGSELRWAPRHPCWEDRHTSLPWPVAPGIACCLHPLLCSQSFGIDGENLRQIDRNTLVWSDPTLLLKILFLQGLHCTLSEHLMSSGRQTTGFGWTVALLEGRALVEGLHWTTDRAQILPVQP